MNKFLQTERIALAFLTKVSLTLLALILSGNVASAQRPDVVLSAKTISVRKAMTEVEAQTGYNFGFGDDLNLDRLIRLKSLSVSLDEVLAGIVGNDFAYRYSGNYIIIAKKGVVEAPRLKALSGEKLKNTETKPTPRPMEAESVRTDTLVVPAEEKQRVSELIVSDAPVFTPRMVRPVALYSGHRMKAALKTNLLYWATTTPNVGVEFSLSDKFSLEISGGINTIKFKSKENSNPKLMHWSLMPEVRYWFCRSFEGMFLGLHAMGGKFNVEDVPLINKPEYRSKGYTVGGGFNFGYQWALGKSWGFEMSAGVGALYLRYRKYECGSCGELMDKRSKMYYGPTKCSISFLYFIK